jgi:hypothetical protein
MAKMMKTAERTLHKRTNKMLASATKRYKKIHAAGGQGGKRL